MSAAILPFPLVRRSAYISKQAEQMTGMMDDAAERYLGHQLKVQGDAMRRRGVSEDLVVSELRCMEAAIRREFDTAMRAV